MEPPRNQADESDLKVDISAINTEIRKNINMEPNMLNSMVGARNELASANVVRTVKKKTFVKLKTTILDEQEEIEAS